VNDIGNELIDGFGGKNRAHATGKHRNDSNATGKHRNDNNPRKLTVKYFYHITR
jgi:hypothetical protein